MFHVLLGSISLLCTSVFAANPDHSEGIIKVFLLAGQSNMEGQADLRVLDYLKGDPDTRGLHETIFDADGNHATIPNTWISYLTGGPDGDENGNREVSGTLQIGYGTQFRRDYSKHGTKIGPELGFGYAMQQFSREPVLIIKVAWGGKEEQRTIRFFGEKGSLLVDLANHSEILHDFQGEFQAIKTDSNEFPLELEWIQTISMSTGNLPDNKTVFPSQGAILRSIRMVEHFSELSQSEFDKINRKPN